MAADKFYAWSDLYFGGEADDVRTPTGGVRHVVTKRNIIRRGEAVTKTKLGIKNDEEWEALLAGGSVRPYPLPDEANESVSPTQAVLSRLYRGDGDIDQDMLLELAMTQPAVNPPAEEGKETPVGV